MSTQFPARKTLSHTSTTQRFCLHTPISVFVHKCRTQFSSSSAQLACTLESHKHNDVLYTRVRHGHGPHSDGSSTLATTIKMLVFFSFIQAMRWVVFFCPLLTCAFGYYTQWKIYMWKREYARIRRLYAVKQSQILDRINLLFYSYYTCDCIHSV